MNRNVIKTLAVAGLALAAAASQAAGPDFTSLTTAVDFSTVGVAILAVAALQVVPSIVSWGAKRIKAFIGR